ncbi:UNVERIFIED_CONTAM: hypothetical protein FKN15_050900 [Acipenser sinensis]
MLAVVAVPAVAMLAVGTQAVALGTLVTALGIPALAQGSEAVTVVSVAPAVCSRPLQEPCKEPALVVAALPSLRLVQLRP